MLILYYRVVPLSCFSSLGSRSGALAVPQWCPSGCTCPSWPGFDSKSHNLFHGSMIFSVSMLPRNIMEFKRDLVLVPRPLKNFQVDAALSIYHCLSLLSEYREFLSFRTVFSFLHKFYLEVGSAYNLRVRFVFNPQRYLHLTADFRYPII